MSDGKKSANNLKELRVSHGYTQDFVASYLEIARQTYSHYENGRRMPPYNVIQRLAGFYKIDIGEITLDASADIVHRENAASDRNSMELRGFLEFCNEPENRRRFKYLNRSEKELIYYYEQIPEDYRWELVEFSKVLARKV